MYEAPPGSRARITHRRTTILLTWTGKGPAPNLEVLALIWGWMLEAAIFIPLRHQVQAPMDYAARHYPHLIEVSEKGLVAVVDGEPIGRRTFEISPSAIRSYQLLLKKAREAATPTPAA